MSASPNGHSVTDISALRAKRRRPATGIMYLPLSDDLTVGVMIANLETLISQGKLPDPLIGPALNVGKKMRDDDGNVDPAAYIESVEFMDALCDAIVVEPPWKLMTEAGAGAVPEGYLCLADLNEEERAAIFRLVYGGLESYEAFREERRSAALPPDGEGLRDEAEQPADDDGSVGAASEAVAGSGDLAEVPAGGDGGGEERGSGPAPADDSGASDDGPGGPGAKPGRGRRGHEAVRA